MEELIARASAEATRDAAASAQREQELATLAGGGMPSMDAVLAQARRLATGYAGAPSGASEDPLDTLLQGPAADSASLGDAMSVLGALPGSARTAPPPAAPAPPPAASNARVPEPEAEAEAETEAEALAAVPAPEPQVEALEVAFAPADPQEIPLQALAEEEPAAPAARRVAATEHDEPSQYAEPSEYDEHTEAGADLDVEEGEFSFEESREFDAFTELTVAAVPEDPLAGSASLDDDEEQFSEQPTALHTREQVDALAYDEEPLTPLPPARPESEDDLSGYRAQPALSRNGVDGEDFGESLSVDLAAGALDADQLMASGIDQLTGEHSFDNRATHNIERAASAVRAEDLVENFIEEVDEELLDEAPIEELDLDEAVEIEEDEPVSYSRPPPVPQPPPMPPPRPSAPHMQPPNAVAGGTPPYPPGVPPQGQPPGEPVYPTATRPDPYGEPRDGDEAQKPGFFRRIFNKDT